MPEITMSVNINSSPDKVFQALTDQSQVRLWWTPDCKLDPTVGGVANLEFKGKDGSLDGYALMRIERLIPATLVEWSCLDHNYQGFTDWIGTTIKFHLSDNGSGGTELDLAHVGWQDEQGCYKMCVDGWTHVLKTSLKNYLETGKGEPYLLAKDKILKSQK